MMDKSAPPYTRFKSNNTMNLTNGLELSGRRRALSLM
jgi:hypothetical protein